MDEYGNLEQEEEEEGKKRDGKNGVAAKTTDEADLVQKPDPTVLMQEEERNTGSVTWETYGKYLSYAGGIIWAPIIILLLTLTQGAQGTSTFH